MIPDTIAHFFLIFSNASTIVLIMLTGFLVLNRSLFFQAGCLATLDILVNVALKGSFKVPLPAHLGPYYAFPSGHMQLSVVFYLWLALFIPFLPWRLFVAFILPGIAAGLIHYQYHDLYEVVGGVFFGVLLLAGYCLMLKNFTDKAAWLISSVACVLMLYNALIYHTIPPHAWSAYYTLAGLIIVERCHYYGRKKSGWSFQSH